MKIGYARVSTTNQETIRQTRAFEQQGIDKVFIAANAAIGPDMVMLFHIGDLNSEKSAPERLAKVLDALPELRVIAAHFGGYSMWERAKQSLVGRKVWLDTSSAIPFMEISEAVEIVRTHGADRILWGSDYPAVQPGTAIAQLQSLGLSAEEQEKIFYRNAEALLNIHI